jgi:hypothetical protein
VGCNQSDSYDQMKEDKIGGSCSSHESDEKCMQSLARKSEGKKGTTWETDAQWKDSVFFYYCWGGTESLGIFVSSP